MRQINKAGLELLKKFEGCKLTAYKDVGGILTIGYGHTGPDVTTGLTVTPEHATDLLKKDLERFCQGVESKLSRHVMLNDNQFSALVCFAYNVGVGAFGLSTLCHRINANDVSDLRGCWEAWNHVNGKVIPGLTKRRQAEFELWGKKDD